MSTTDRMIYQVPETRERILDEAIRLITAHGLDGVTMAQIATAAGLSRTSLYRYYRDKLDISLAVTERLVAEHMPAMEDLVHDLDASTTGREELGLYLRAMTLGEAFTEVERFLARFDAYFVDDRVPDDFAERLGAVFSADTMEPLAAAYRRGVADGSIRSDLDPATALVAVINALRAFKQRMLLRPGALIELGDISPAATLETMLDIVLDGLKPTKGNR